MRAHTRTKASTNDDVALPRPILPASALQRTTTKKIKLMKKIFTLLALALASITSGFAQGLTLPTAESKNVYTLSTPRGALLADNSKSDKYLCSSRQFTDVTFNETNPDLRFQFLLFPAEGATNGFYAYSVKTKKFIGANETETINVTMSEEPVVLYMYSTGQTGTNRNNGESGTWAKTFSSADYPFTISHANNTINQTINVSAWANSYGIRNSGASQYDGGNDYRILAAETTVDENIFNEAKTKIMASKIAELQTKVDDIVRKSSASAAGYPVITDDKMVALANYISVPGNPGINVTNYDDALAALNEAYEVTNVNLPEDGKAYTIKAKFHDNTYKYLAYSNGNTGYLNHADDASTNWVAKKVGDTFALVDAATGKYLYVESQSYKNNTTDKTKYDAKALLTIGKVAPNKGESVNNATSEELFGCLTIKGKSLDNHTFVLLASQDNQFRHDDASFYYYDCAMGQWNSSFYRSCEFIFEEVENPNKLKLSNPNPEGTSGLDGKSVGTFSAPFAVQLPDGVEAYKATVDGSTVTFETIGSVVPANTGVLVYAENGTTYNNVNAVPAATVASTVNDNALHPTTGGEIPVGSYILANKNNHVAFYLINPDSRTVAKNKAYLVAPTSSNLNAFRFDFEDTLTGIQGVENESSIVVYDLQGRRVQNAKSGLYIVNGKKVIR